jgi:hypothetical protein
LGDDKVSAAAGYLLPPVVDWYLSAGHTYWVRAHRIGIEMGSIEILQMPEDMQ